MTFVAREFEEMRSVEEINQAIRVLKDVCQHYPVSCEGCPLESGDWCVLEIEPESWVELEEDDET